MSRSWYLSDELPQLSTKIIMIMLFCNKFSLKIPINEPRALYIFANVQNFIATFAKKVTK